MKNYFVQSKIRYTTVFRFLSSFVFFVISVFAFPQNVKTWKIRVTDLENLSVIGVRLKLNICEREIEGFTDENGILKYQLSECDTCTRAFISVRSNMYMPLDTIVDFSSSVDSEITLMPKALDEVEVVGYKTISKGNAEKVTFKTDFTKGLLKSAKADIALRRIPNIVYSGGSFMFTGKQKKAKLFVNGMEVPDEELSKIDAKDIYKVELHRVSLNDDKYSGEINVVLKKSLNAQYSGEIDMGTNLLNTGFGVNPSKQSI